MQKIEITNIQQFFDAVYQFNQIAGNLDPVESAEDLTTRIRAQAERVLEEAQELIDACDADDPIGILDGTIDQLVTAFGSLMLLAPYANTQEAARRICQNNLDKFLVQPGEDDIARQVNYYADQGIEVEVEVLEVDGETLGVIRRLSDRKVMKPAGFEPVDLEGLI